MSSKNSYRTVGVQHLSVPELVPQLNGGCIVALDVAKQKFVGALATLTGVVVKLFRFEHPTQTPVFLELVQKLCAALGQNNVKVAMEPTGTYGDAIRHQLVKQGVCVQMVSPKRTYDSRELFDGVPSSHDAKSAVLVAKLCGMGLATPWVEPPQMRVRLRALVDQRQFLSEQEERGQGHLEAVLARLWPEYGRWLDSRKQHCALKLLVTFPSPARVAHRPQEAKALLKRSSCSRLSEQAMQGVLDDAAHTLGVPAVAEEEQLVSSLAEELLLLNQRSEAVEKQMCEVARLDEVFTRLRPEMGAYTAAVTMTRVDPRQYASARQMEKASGLNLREKSSGEKVGTLSITKRGPGLVRQVLYMLALRKIKDSVAVRAWYQRRRGYSEETKIRAIVAVMRKLVRAMWHVARGASFDESKLFDLRRLDLQPEAVAAPQAASTSQVSEPKSTVPQSAVSQASASPPVVSTPPAAMPLASAPPAALTPQATTTWQVSAPESTAPQSAISQASASPPVVSTPPAAMPLASAPPAALAPQATTTRQVSAPQHTVPQSALQQAAITPLTASTLQVATLPVTVQQTIAQQAASTPQAAATLQPKRTLPPPRTTPRDIARGHKRASSKRATGTMA